MESYLEKILRKNNSHLLKLDITHLEIEKNNYYSLLSTNSFDNDIIMNKINFIDYLIQYKKNK